MTEDLGAEAAKAALTSAVEGQTDDALAAWAATGASGLIVLHDLLSGEYQPSWPGLHPKDAIDGVAAAVSAIAIEHPEAFMKAFDDPGLVHSVDVLIGLGWIKGPAATARLLDAAGAANTWMRLQAIIGLARRATPEAEAALIRAIDDPENLVRYQALKGLAATGTPDALPALRRFRGESDFERQLAATAIARIEERTLGAPWSPPSTQSERNPE